MKHRSQKLAVKGFTLLEMMIVLGIIAVLTAVVVPISRGYYASSRMRAQNSNAKVIYNSLQTVCQEFEFADRSVKGSLFYGNGDTAELQSKTGTLALIIENGSLTKVFENESKTAATADDRTITLTNGNKISVPLRTALYNVNLTPNDSGSWNTAADPDPSNFVQRVNRIFSNSETTSYVAFIQDYSVRAVFSGDTMDSYYIGAFPNRIDEESEFTLKDLAFDQAHGDFVVNYVNEVWGTSFVLK